MPYRIEREETRGTPMMLGCYTVRRSNAPQSQGRGRAERTVLQYSGWCEKYPLISYAPLHRLSRSKMVLRRETRLIIGRLIIPSLAILLFRPTILRYSLLRLSRNPGAFTRLRQRVSIPHRIGTGGERRRLGLAIDLLPLRISSGHGSGKPFVSKRLGDAVPIRIPSLLAPAPLLAWHWPCNIVVSEFLMYGRHKVQQAMEHSGEHLLIVEDEPEMRDLLRKVLEKEGYRISVAGDGREAFGRIAREDFDLVVTDMLMPSVGGIELLETIQRSFPALPVIIVTAFGDWDTYSRALALGAAAFISKPLRMSELTSAVHAALAKRGATASP